MASVVSAHQVVTKVRSAAKNKHVRVNEFFKDFDRLRRGYVTREQFLRCLNQHFSVRLNQDEFDALIREFDKKGDGTVNYRQFSEAVDIGFDPNLLDAKPDEQLTKQIVSVSGPDVSEEEWQVTENLLGECHRYCKYRGINVKDCYEDFDYHHIGLITRDQFFRSFPGPGSMSQEEMELLARRYMDQGTKLYNFLNFHKDVVKLDQSGMRGETRAGSLTLTGKGSEGGDVFCVLERLKVGVYKHGIRTTEFFQDHDKLRSGVITENQFTCGLLLCFRGKTVQLSREEVQLVADEYRASDGRIHYRQFCHVMENAFNVPELEKKPTEAVVQPLRGTLAWAPGQLSVAEEARLDEVMTYLADTVRKRRLLLYPFFKDFDRGKGYTRGVTKTQFARIIDSSQLDVPQEDIKLICRKFENRDTGDINYSAFIQAIDPEYTGQVVEAHNDNEESFLRSKSPCEAGRRSCGGRNVDFGDLLDRMKYHVKINRIRVIEFFQDFDLLRTGSITEKQFRQSVDAMGYRRISDEEFNCLSAHYCNPKLRRCVLYKDFIRDVEIVFTQPNLEATPTRQLPPLDGFVVPKAGCVDWSAVGDEEKEMAEKALARMKEKAAQRRILAKPCFQDFDKHNHGYVTAAQFRQCLCFLTLAATSEDEILAILAKFSDQEGVNYIRFLEEIQPGIRQEPKYPQYISTLQALQLSKTKPPSSAEDSLVDTEQVMTKIKTKVIKERIRVLEFMRDYDSLRTGRMLKTTFPRALDLCSFQLNPQETSALVAKYEYPKDKNYVEYLKFSDDVEAIFTTKDLEKAPTLDVHPFVPPYEVDQNTLTPKEQTTLDLTVHRLAERVRVRSIQLMPLFEDYDRVHIGSVSRSQFRRVLSELELGSLVSDHEFKVLYKKFDVRVGGKDDVSYIAFCDMVSEYAQFVWREKLH